jgi:hypothetical protein
MLFKDFTWSPEDLISQNEYIKLAEKNPDTHIFMYTDSIENNMPTNWRGKIVPEIFPPKQPIWITGMSDYSINANNSGRFYGKYVKWYGINVDIDNPNIQIVPIGVDTHSDYFINSNSFNKIYEIYREPRVLTNTIAYMNFNPHTYLEERSIVYNLFHKEDWIVNHVSNLSLDVTALKEETYESGKQVSYETYCRNVRNHKFTFCPRGCGFDTYRFWESLYLGSIPIVLDCPQMSYFFDKLPVVRINNWKNLTKELLEKEYERIHKTEYDFSILKMGYWKNMILNI